MEVAVTGIGAVCALGWGKEAVWRALATGEDGIRPISRFDTASFTTQLGALVPGREGERDAARLAVDFALGAAREALDEAGIGAMRRVALALGTSLGDGGSAPCRVTEAVGDALRIDGPRLTVSTACSSSSNAIGLGCDLLAAGEADVVVAGGTDVLTPEIFAGFHALGVLSPAPCAPFSLPAGTTLGEGAGFLVLEPASLAAARAAHVRALVSGYGLSGDGYHETSPEPRGAGVARAIAAALRHARIVPDDIGYVNAHGTGTAANDPAEWLALQAVLGPRAAEVPASSSKGHLGHAQGAAGVLEIICTLLALAHGTVPPTLHFRGPRPRAPADPVGEPLPRSHRYRHAVCTSSAFGGSNCAVVLSAASAGAHTPEAPRPVAIVGAAAIGAHGESLDALARALADGGSLAGRRVEAPLRRLVPRADTRGLDPAAELFTAAAAMALGDAGLDVRGDARDRSGLVVGATHVSPTSARAFTKSFEERGPARVSTAAFARMVLNASQGTCAMLLSLRGPQTTVSAGSASGLLAVIQAARWLARRDDADAMVAGSFEEADERTPLADGAACVVLVAASDATPIVVAGSAVAAPGMLDDAVARALAEAGLDRADAVFGQGGAGHSPRERWVDPGRAFGRDGALASAIACVAAIHALRRGVADHALVVDPGGSSAACALALVRRRTLDA